MKKLILLVALVCAGMMTSCVDKNEAVDADSKPEWLGSSIYEELSNPNQSYLTGTFKYYLRLVDDLGYASTLSRTGSKTVFPANDEAFARFFQSNDWGVTSYEQLSTAQKKQLLYTSMLDNALLLTMLSNVSNGTSDVTRGMAVKHETSVNVIDTITHAYTVAGMPSANKYWQKYFVNGIDFVRDATKPMMVHFTREQMVNNNITTTGENSDFEIITGSPYTEGTAYIFDDKVINSDVTCQNGYIHQMEDVLLPPGNMAEVIEKNNETSIFSHMLNFFCAPYFDQTTTNAYNDWAVANGYETIDSIYQVRYMSANSQGQNALLLDPDRNIVSNYLSFDPGWNQYYPTHGNASTVDYRLTDMGAIFVPSDDALKSYFTEGGPGAYLIDIYGDPSLKNNAENLITNLDSLYAKAPGVVKAHVNNLMMSSFVNSVPSKFTTITNDASENMGMNTSYLKQNSDGKYDVKIANNGVIYILKDMIAPDEYQSVMAPSSTYPDMKVMNWAVQDKTYLGVDFKYYLLAMSANYAFFIPTDEAFDAYYVDPASLGHDVAYALRFYYDETVSKNNHLRCERYYWDKNNNVLGQRVGEITNLDEVKSQLIDILNYHTVVLNAGETIGSGNHYFKTKHGGEIYVSGGNVGDYVVSGGQKDNGLPNSNIQVDYTEKNGHAYRIDHIIQAPQNSVYKVLESNSQFSEFIELCSGFSATDLLTWAGISDVTNEFGTTEQDQYTVFTNTYGTGTNAVQRACLDYNVKFFNTYNYTLYAPDNAAMEIAFNAGLPRWSEIYSDFENYGESASEDVRNQAKLKIKAIRDFVRYHFQSSSLYADKTVEGGTYKSLCSDDMGLSLEMTVSGGDNRISITDVSGKTVTVDANSGNASNIMARDYWFNSNCEVATSITTSSFCAVHQISEPLCYTTTGRYDGSWSSAKGYTAAKRWLAKQKRIYNN